MRERQSVVGGAGDQDRVVPGQPGVLGPGDVDVAGVGAGRLVDGEVDLVLEEPAPGEVGGRRALLHEHGPVVRAAVVRVPGDVDATVDGLSSVEADERVE